MKNGFNLDGKEGNTNIQISAEPGLKWGAFGLKAEILELLQPCPPKLLEQTLS